MRPYHTSCVLQSQSTASKYSGIDIDVVFQEEKMFSGS